MRAVRFTFLGAMAVSVVAAPGVAVRAVAAPVAAEAAESHAGTSDVARVDHVELPDARKPDEVFHPTNDGVPAVVGRSRRNGGHGHDRRSLADKHAPAGLMGDHVHDAGEVMVEYKYMNMYMEGNRVGHRRISDTAALGITVDGIRTNVGAAPTQMTMEMHMLHLMYGVTDDVTVYTMLMFPSLTMDHLRGPGNPATGTFTTQTSGIGDTSFGALVRLYETCDTDVILNLGFSVPTGEIFSTSTNPTAGRVVQALPYPMRRGSGTFDARPGLTYKRYFDHGSFGTQFQTDLPVGRNYRGYTVGDEYRYNVWYSLLATDDLAFSLRLENLWQSTYNGADPATPDAVISTNVEAFRGGYWLNLGIGVAALVEGHLLNVEFIPTLYQDVHGTQLGTDWSFVASWSKSY